MGLTGSAISWLINKQSTFIFATHMHDLLKLSYIENLPEKSLKICHLSVTYDESQDVLIYDRKLREGPGASSYGITVAKSLGLPSEFIDTANEILLEITGKNKYIIDPKRSRYNNEVYVDSCVMCHKNKLQTELNNHHIIEQSKAIDNIVSKIESVNGIDINYGSMHKNSKDNLITLCKSCHANLHSSGMELETLIVPQGKIIRIKPDISINQELTS